MLLAIDLEDIVVTHGGEVVNAVPTVALALAAIRTRRPDAVILDRNLDGEPTDRVAEALAEGGIPFVVVSGYGASKMDHASFRGVPFIRKPYDPDVLVRCLATLLS